MKLSGYTMVRNALELDYPVHLTVQSLLHGCDEVVVGVAESTDGTGEWLQDLFGREQRVRLVGQPWSQPHGDVRWWVRWINETRKHLTGDHQLLLDADEVVDPGAFPGLWGSEGQCVTLRRLNYWRHVRQVVRSGYCCSDQVVRFAPTSMWMTSDEIYRSQDFPEDEPPIRRAAVPRLDLFIHHLGFLRKREALFKKVEVCLKAFFGQGQDARLVAAAGEPEKHWADFVDQPVEGWSGRVPGLVVEWLKERGAL
jgi:hypothetical protein